MARRRKSVVKVVKSDEQRVGKLLDGMAVIAEKLKAMGGKSVVGK